MPRVHRGTRVPTSTSIASDLMANVIYHSMLMHVLARPVGTVWWRAAGRAAKPSSRRHPHNDHPTAGGAEGGGAHAAAGVACWVALLLLPAAVSTGMLLRMYSTVYRIIMYCVEPHFGWTPCCNFLVLPWWPMDLEQAPRCCCCWGVGRHQCSARPEVGSHRARVGTARISHRQCTHALPPLIASLPAYCIHAMYPCTTSGQRHRLGALVPTATCNVFTGAASVLCARG